MFPDSINCVNTSKMFHVEAFFISQNCHNKQNLKAVEEERQVR